MCAIVSWCGATKRGQWPLVQRLLKELLIASACRGADATGFAALDARHGLLVEKQPLPSKQFLRTSRWWNRLLSPSCLIGHCRAATHGSPFAKGNINNHPFVGDGLAVVVNGMAMNYRTAAQRHGLDLTTDCDSEVVLRFVEASSSPAMGLHDALQELDGGMAAAVLDVQRRTVWLARNEDRPLWLLKLIGVQGFFACSTREIAECALFAAFGKRGLAAIELLMPLAPYEIAAVSAAGTLTVALPTSRDTISRGICFK